MKTIHVAEEGMVNLFFLIYELFYNSIKIIDSNLTIFIKKLRNIRDFQLEILFQWLSPSNQISFAKIFVETLFSIVKTHTCAHMCTHASAHKA